jgi:predicted ester cyclase
LPAKSTAGPTISEPALTIHHAASNQPKFEDTGMSPHSDVEANKELFLEFQKQVLSQHDVSEKTLNRLITSEFVDHSDRSDDVRGHRAVTDRLRAWTAPFPDSREETTKIIAERDLVAVMFTTTGRHSAPYLGIPITHRDVAIKGIRIVRVERGRIAELWAVNDYLAIATQLSSQIEFRPGAPKANYFKGPRRPRPSREAMSYQAQVARIQTDSDEVRRNITTLLGFQRDVFNAQDWRIDTLARYLKPDIEDHNEFAGDPPGLEGVQYRFSGWQAAFDDAEEENMAMVGEENMLAVLYNLHATHRGPFMGIPATNRHVVIPGIEVLRFEGGLIAEHWGIYDFMATAEEIGAKLVFKAAEFGSVA